MSKNPKNWWKSLKIADIDREILHIFSTTWRISIKKFFRKDVTYDNIKSHKKQGFHPLFRRCIFEKTTRPQGEEGEGVDQIDPPPPQPF